MRIIDIIKQQKKPFFSLEFFPPRKEEQFPSFLSVVDKLKELNPLFASVTYGAGGSLSANTLHISKSIQKKGIIPMPHLTCIGASELSIKEFLDDLAQNDIHNVLALRGDLPNTDPNESAHLSDNFKYASDLITYIHKMYPEFGVAVAAYPFPHPQSSSFSIDRQHTKNKLALSKGFAITQIFFDNREYFSLCDDLIKEGCTLPVLPGVLPIQSLESIRRILSLSNGNIPAQLYLALEEANKNGGQEAVKEAGIAFAVEQIRQLIAGGAPGIHLYTLNQSETTTRVLEQAKLL